MESISQIYERETKNYKTSEDWRTLPEIIDSLRENIVSALVTIENIERDDIQAFHNGRRFGYEVALKKANDVKEGKATIDELIAFLEIGSNQ